RPNLSCFTLRLRLGPGPEATTTAKTACQLPDAGVRPVSEPDARSVFVEDQHGERQEQADTAKDGNGEERVDVTDRDARRAGKKPLDCSTHVTLQKNATKTQRAPRRAGVRNRRLHTFGKTGYR